MALERSLLKYFGHGLVFSSLMTGLMLVWAVILVVLVSFGYIIGLIIGFVILFLMMGELNAALTSWIWDITISIDWVSALIEGLVLFIALIIVSIPAIIVDYVVPSVPTTVVVFVVCCFIDGLVARIVGESFEGNE